MDGVVIIEAVGQEEYGFTTPFELRVMVFYWARIASASTGLNSTRKSDIHQCPGS